MRLSFCSLPEIAADVVDIALLMDSVEETVVVLVPVVVPK